jgi:hypothetical protein
MLDRQEGAALVGGDDIGEIVHVDILHRRLDRAGDAGDIDQDIDAPAENLQRLGDHRLDLGFLDDVAGHHMGFAAKRAHFGRHFFQGQGVGVARGQQHVCACARQRRGDGGAHALGGAGNDGLFAFQFHRIGPR